MKDIKIVIGAGFGDEGKGLMTDYFSSRSNNGIVVRFNGGAQAGHTVITPEGKRHVFGHFGSGTFLELPTYLSSFYVTNPLLFKKEYQTLKSLNISPVLYVDKNCLVSTPYDMMVNQIVESDRGCNRHGSCGVGFNETIYRSLQKDLRIEIRDFKDIKNLEYKLNFIRKEYVFNRLGELKVKEIPNNFLRYFESKNIIDKFIEDIQFMEKNIQTLDSSVLNSFNSIIFEGAQGLALDQNHKFFPHVTRSNTGMKNVVDILSETNLDKENIEIVYTTRAYATRHGAGPFPTETRIYPNIVDSTNKPNPFQGALRIGLLDTDFLIDLIDNDSEKFKYKRSIAITCLDQIRNEDLEFKVYFILNGNICSARDIDFIQTLEERIDPCHIYMSYGPTRETILSSQIKTFI